MNTSAVSTQRILVESQGQLARITLSHPPLNVIGFEMMDELLAALQQLEKNPEIIAVVINGSERAFSAGVDVGIHTPDKIETMLQKFHGLIMALVKFPKITIAEVQGACLGGGAELAMACDMVYTTPDSKWGFPEITLGCYPPVACAALAALVGQKARSRSYIYRSHIQRRRSRGMGHRECRGHSRSVASGNPAHARPSF